VIPALTLTIRLPDGSLEAARVHWQFRLDAARAAYEQAAAETEVVLKQGGPAVRTPDAALARKLALSREAAATDRYVQRLKAYADLVMLGVLPEEED